MNEDHNQLVRAIKRYASSRSDVHAAMYEVFGPPSNSPARDFLEQQLSTGPKKLYVLRERAEKAGIKYMTLRQAAKRMRLTSTLHGKGKSRYAVWELRNE